jgi:hypothetical protein
MMGQHWDHIRPFVFELRHPLHFIFTQEVSKSVKSVRMR